MSEHQEQSAFFKWIDIAKKQETCLGLFFAVPNGGLRPGITAKMLKREGVKKGVLDTLLPVARGGYHGLWIEFKYGANKLSDEQILFKKGVEKEGYRAEVAYSWEEAKDITLAYLNEALP